MSHKAVRPSLAALLGAASLSVALSAEAHGAADIHARAPTPERAVGEASSQEPSSLRELIDQRLERAAARGRHEEIEELGTLWMTLAQREQLDRVVERGDGFLNVALRNQRYSELRAEARARRAAPIERSVLEELGPTNGWAQSEQLDERLDVERFVSNLGTPYRDAVELSLEGLNHREIAERLGVSHAAARKWAQRLRERVSWRE